MAVEPAETDATQQAVSMSRPRRNIRKRCDDGDSDDEPTCAISEAMELRQSRKRHLGVDAADLLAALGNGTGGSTENGTDDPLRLKSGGGLANMNALKKITSDSAAGLISSKSVVAESSTVGVGSAFASETKRREEDIELLRYVEAELTHRRRGTTEATPTTAAGAQNKPGDPKTAIYALPDYLKVSSKAPKQEGDMLPLQMLTGIPEVDLGLDAKMKNIEETEAAKQRLLAELRNDEGDDASAYVPTNMSTNYVQHNRWASLPNARPATMQAAFAIHGQRKTELAAERAKKAAEEAEIAANRPVVQIVEPGSEGVGYIKPKVVDDNEGHKGNNRHHHHRNNRRDNKRGHDRKQT